MAKLWRITWQNGEVERSCKKRFFISEAEARLIIRGEAGGAAKLEAVEFDELELRQAAANWLNASEVKRIAAKKREANKTAKQRSDNMKKAWATRKKNGEQ